MQQTWEQRAVQWDKVLGNQFVTALMGVEKKETALMGVEKKETALMGFEEKETWKSAPNRKIALSSNFSQHLSKEWSKMMPREVPLQLIDGERADDAVCLVINGNNSSPRNVDHLIRMESSINRGHLPAK